MDVIHFTQGASEPLKGFSATGARFLRVADGTGDTHVSCLHLEKGGSISAPSITHAVTLLVVDGRITIVTHLEARIQFSGGMGAVFERHEPYALKCRHGFLIKRFRFTSKSQFSPHEKSSRRVRIIAAGVSSYGKPS